MFSECEIAVRWVSYNEVKDWLLTPTRWFKYSILWSKSISDTSQISSGDSVGSTVASQQEGPWFESVGLFCVEFACILCVGVCFLHNQKTSRIGDLETL